MNNGRVRDRRYPRQASALIGCCHDKPRAPSAASDHPTIRMRFHLLSPSTCGLSLIALLFSFILAGCGGEGPTWSGEGDVSVRRLELTATPKSIEYPDLMPLGRWDEFREGGQHSDWTIRGGELSLFRFQDQEILRVVRNEETVISIPVDLVIRERCVLELMVLVRGAKTPFTVSLFKGKERIATEEVVVAPSPNLQVASFEMRFAEREPQKVTRVAFHLPGGENPILLRSVSLKQGALGMELDSKLFGGYGLVELRGEARRSTVLPSDHKLRASFIVEDKSERLQFSFAQSEVLHMKDQRVALVLSLRSGKQSLEKIFEFEEVGEGKKRESVWGQAEIFLDDWVGKDVEATWHLKSSEGLAMSVLGRPRVSKRGAPAETVLLVTSDTHRSDYLGFLMEDGELVTDGIDKLASDGVAFLDAVSSVNNTTPSHVSLFTGLSPRDTGIVANATRLADSAPTLAEAYRDAGYVTLAAVSATPVDYKLCGLGQGFDRYSIPLGKGVRRSEQTIEMLMDWVEEYDGAPVFMWVHIYDAHGPYDPPDHLKLMYYEGDKDPFDHEAPGAEPSMAPYWNKNIADPDYTEALYKSEITFLDRRLSELFDLPRVEEGIVAFTSDHGEVLRYGPRDSFDHRGLSLNTLAVPMIFRAPGLEAGVQRNDPVLQIDVGRTLLNLSGLNDSPFPGRDVLETTLEPGEPRFAMQANAISASVLTDKWMFALNLRLPGSFKGTAAEREDFVHSVELYDIVADKFCRFNVWEENKAKATVLRRSVIRWLARGQQNDWETEAETDGRDIAQELADLGYVTVERSASDEWFDDSCACEWCQKFAE
ncbi:MAG: arylsulfatase A-like enzyme [Planctomycetota bacterium]|jgi:arylsulfatase A-like enzyme